MKGPTSSSNGRDGRRRLRNVLGFAVSAVSLIAVIWWATKQERPRFPTGGRELLELAGCLFIYAFITVLRGWRWHTILRRAHIDHAPADAYALTVVGYMGNNVLPARSGELLRVLLLGERSTARRRVILGTIIAERFLDLVTIVTLFAVLTAADVAGKPLGLAPLALVAGVALAAATMLALLKGFRRRGRLERFAAVVRPFALATRLLINRSGALLAALTVVVWMLEAATFWLVGDSLNLGFTPVEALFLVVLIGFVSIIPSAPGYIGTFEAAVVFGLHSLGIEGGQALAFALLIRFLLYVPITFVGLALMLARYGGIPRLRSRAVDAARADDEPQPSTRAGSGSPPEPGLARRSSPGR
jgi:glycosyltransferase 2 family protein